MIDKLKTVDIRNIILIIFSLLFSYLAIDGTLDKDNIMMIITMAMTFLFAKSEVKKQ